VVDGLLVLHHARGRLPKSVTPDEVGEVWRRAVNDQGFLTYLLVRCASLPETQSAYRSVKAFPGLLGAAAIDDLSDYGLAFLDAAMAVSQGLISACEFCEDVGSWKAHCPKCGKRLPDTDKPTTGRACMFCETWIEEGHRYCSGCGRESNSPKLKELEERLLAEEKERLNAGCSE